LWGGETRVQRDRLLALGECDSPPGRALCAGPTSPLSGEARLGCNDAAHWLALG
jgi:hypothetical protein